MIRISYLASAMISGRPAPSKTADMSLLLNRINKSWTEHLSTSNRLRTRIYGQKTTSKWRRVPLQLLSLIWSSNTQKKTLDLTLKMQIRPVSPPMILKLCINCPSSQFSHKACEATRKPGLTQRVCYRLLQILKNLLSGLTLQEWLMTEDHLMEKSFKFQNLLNPNKLLK